MKAHFPFQSPDSSKPSDSQEPGGKGHHGTKRDENDTTEDEREQDNKRQHLQVLSSENVIFRSLQRIVGEASEKLINNVMLKQLEFDNDASEQCMTATSSMTVCTISRR